MHERSQIEIRRKDIACMAPLQWLNDEVINLYMSLLLERDMRARSKVHALIYHGGLRTGQLPSCVYGVLEDYMLKCMRNDLWHWARRWVLLQVHLAAHILTFSQPQGGYFCSQARLYHMHTHGTGLRRACSPSATSSAPSSSTSSTRTPATITRT